MSFVLGLDGIDEYERNLRNICNYAFAYGIKTYRASNPSFNPKTASKAESDKFIARCHEGFALAQDLIVKQLMQIQAKQRDYRSQLKDARHRRDKTEVCNCEANIIYLTNREFVLRKVADGIAWQLWGLQRWNLRRLYLGRRMPYLDASNIDSVTSEVKDINKDPLCFGLIADITSFIQIGDILKVDRSSDVAKIHLIEMKSGEMNAKVIDFIKQFDKIQCPRIPYFFAQEYGKKALAQAIRVTTQQMKAAQVLQIVQTGKGKDPYLDQDINIPDDILLVDDYDETLNGLVGKCKSDGKAHSVIDECLFVGVYDPSRFPAYLSDFINFLYFTVSGTGRKQEPFLHSEEFHIHQTKLFLQRAYPIYDLRLSLKIPLAQPLFMRRIAEETMLNIVFGKLIVLLYLDYDKWFGRAKSKGLEARWSTEQEFRKCSEKGYFKVSDRIPVFEKQGGAIFIGDGILTRIIEGTTPDSILELLDHSLTYHMEKKK